MISTVRFLICSTVFGLSAIVTGYPGPAHGEASRPRPGPYKAIWQQFYGEDDGEAQIVAVLVEAGHKMVPSICRAILDSKMERRGYAILALGYIKDRRAILTLETIYSDTDEGDNDRAEALFAIHIIDQPLGRQYGKRALKAALPADSSLRETADAILHRSEFIDLDFNPL